MNLPLGDYTLAGNRQDHNNHEASYADKSWFEWKMTDEFDPYRKWLGIPPSEQPPNHYRLLGIALFEDDPDVIENAADRQMGHVRTYQSGQHASFSQRLLNELSAAKLCLLNVNKKTEYDRQLASPAPAESPPPSQPTPLAPPVAGPPQHELSATQATNVQSSEPMAATRVSSLSDAPAITEVDKRATTTRSRSVGGLGRARRRNSALGIMLIVLSIFALLVIVLLAYLIANSNESSELFRTRPHQQTSYQDLTVVHVVRGA